MTEKPNVAVVGCGKVGGTLAVQLHRLGWPVTGLASRRLASATALRELLGSGQTTETPWEVTPSSGVVFITTPDDAVRPVCETIAENGGFTPGTVVFHSSGAHSSELLARAAEAGALTGSLHPLQAFASIIEDRNPFEGIIMAVEGHASAVDIGRQMAHALGARPLALKTDGKTLYHAAAVVASNYLVSLVDTALEMLGAAGIDRGDALDVLSPLIKGTLNNIARHGTTEALTGPIVRGDTDTVALHLEALKARLDHLLPAYRSLGRQALGIARKKGHLSEDTIAALRHLLSDEPTADR